MINGALHFGLTILLKKRTKEKKKMIPFCRRNIDKEQSSAIITISVDAKGTVFPEKLKLQRGSFE